MITDLKNDILDVAKCANLVYDIFHIVKSIYDQVQQVKANRVQCQRLYERIALATHSLKSLESIPENEHYRLGLLTLKKSLEQCLPFIRQFVDQRWFVQVLKAGTAKGRFAELNDNIYKAIQQLGLGIQAQQLIDHKQDKKDQAADYAALVEKQDEVIQLNQTLHKQIQQLQVQQMEQAKILAEQAASMKLQIRFLDVRKAPQKPLWDPHFMVRYYELAFDRKLSESGFSKTYVGKWGGQVVVIKTLEGAFTDNDQAQFVREIQIMSRLHHPNITTLYGATLELNHPCLVMEYLESSLFDMLERALTPEQQKSIALDIASGLHYLHDQGVIHRYLKSTNILLNAQGQAKLADFCLAKIQTGSIQTAVVAKQSQAIEWLAPECLRGEVPTVSSDIYSFGIILWEISTNQRCHTKLDSDSVLSGKREDIPPSVPDVLANLIRRCWHQDPSQRPPIAEVIQTLENYNTPTLTAEACYEQGLHYDETKQYAKAFAAYQQAEAKGYYKACANLGLFLVKGWGVSQDKQAGYQCFLKGAEQGHPRAMFNLATMLENGDGVEKDLSKALEWYEKAAQMGDEKAKAKCQKLQIGLAAAETKNPVYLGHTKK
jgi:Protein tyrosine and serine/threonine kinase/Sel1 repeat